MQQNQIYSLHVVSTYENAFSIS